MLETKRLLLRHWKDEDIPAFAAMNQDPAVMAYFPATLTNNETEQLVTRIRQHFETKGFGLFAIELKSIGAFIGFVGLMTPSFEAHFTPCVEIGWRLAKPYWHQGYATEAARAVLSLAFEKYGLPEVVSFTTMANTPSIRVMEKIGLQHDPRDDFNHPKLPADHPLSRHVLYRLTAKTLRERDTIVITPYHSEWPQQAAAEIIMLKQCLHFPWIVDMQHIGSTAVPGLPAKPIIDLAIGVSDFSKATELISVLQSADYIFWEDNPDKTKLFFVKGMPPFGEQRTHHIHVMPVTHHDWLLRPLFRDYLISHPETKIAYAALKQSLALQCQDDREAYTESKTTFIRKINLKAIESHLHFTPLKETDFPRLLRWLEQPHVKAWWDQEIHYTPEKVQQKYQSYVAGYKIEQGIQKTIGAYLIAIDKHPIGYIQFYNAYDFPRDVALDIALLPKKLAALDFYIGDTGFLKKGFSPVILRTFLREYVANSYQYCLVDPDTTNTTAVCAYEKAGFIKMQSQAHATTLMLINLLDISA